MWNNEKQQKNAIEIARQAGALYDKFEGFVNDLTKVGKKMDEAKTCLLYTSPSPRDRTRSRMPSSA